MVVTEDAGSWPITRVETDVLLSLEEQPLSISQVARAVDTNRKAVRRALDGLSSRAWVVEVETASGPGRIHALTEEGERVAGRLRGILAFLDACNGGSGHP